MVPAALVAVALIVGAALGWGGCYSIYVLRWKVMAGEALELAQVYAMAYFKSNANPNCENCEGKGFFPDGININPCPECHGESMEITLVDGQLRDVKVRPASAQPVSRTDNSEEGKR